MKIEIGFEEAKNNGTLGRVLHDWISIQKSDNMLWDSIDDLVAGWIDGKHKLIYDTEELCQDTN